MNDFDTLAEIRLQLGMPIEHGGQIDRFAFLDQRAHPIGALAAPGGFTDGADHFFAAVRWHRRRLDRLASRRLLIKHGKIHVAMN